MQLKPDTLLKGGEYRIIRTLGQGGFGITYEAEQVLLRRTVAVKEFFMKDCCERNLETYHVTIGTGSQRELVEKFRGKFIREAQMIARMEHPHIVHVIDVFEENGTAYYVMEYLAGNSLAEKVKKDGPLSEAKAEEYIRQVADALAYIHSKNTVHLDVKPSNILLNGNSDVVLVDFGISKHYDESGKQTSSTPIGISKGYAPLEQGRDGDVSQFKPTTDVYALGATLYYLVTGLIPPDASIIYEEGLVKPSGLSERIWKTIEQSMQPRQKDRPQDIDEFLSLLKTPMFKDSSVNQGNEQTVVKKQNGFSQEKNATYKSVSGTAPRSPKKWLWALLSGISLITILLVIIFIREKGQEKSSAGFPSKISTSVSATSNKEIHEDEVIISEADLKRNKDNLVKVYSILREENYTDIGKTLEEFSSMMSLVTNRKLAYEIMCKDYEMGTFEEFDERFYPATEEHLTKEKDRRWLYRMLREEGVAVGDYDAFCLLLCFDDDLRNYYNLGIQVDLNLGSFEEFRKYIR